MDIAREVAEKVMGWIVKPIESGMPPEHATDFWHDDTGEPMIVSDPEAWESWHPEKNIDQAFQVVEKMRDDGWHCFIDNFEDARVWMVMFRRDNGFGGDNACAMASLPESICRAALEAVKAAT